MNLEGESDEQNKKVFSAPYQRYDEENKQAFSASYQRYDEEEHWQELIFTFFLILWIEN